ncbi:MAG: (2Fe-2S) ferredoxin domain-containing protein, partial [Nitrospiraceae bacterium]
MSEPSVKQSAAERLDGLTLALVVGEKGICADEAVADLRRYAQSKDIVSNAADFDQSLDRAKQQFAEGHTHFFLCDGAPCRRRRRFDGMAGALQQAAETVGCRITLTACQGPCKQAPVATLRVGTQSEMFAQFAQVSQWEAVLGFVKAACKAGTLQIAAESAEPFRYDPDHGSEKPCPAILPLQILIGHIEGMVELPEERRSIHKEVVGSWEVGGRFIALRMAATYQRAGGPNDRHHALVLVGPDGEAGGFLSRAYTDAGLVQDFHLECEGTQLWFADRVPHGVVAKAARKVLAPTAEGYDES